MIAPDFGEIMKKTKIRHQCLLDEALSEKLETFCRRPGTIKSEIIAKAIEAFFGQRGETEIDQRYGKRLDKISIDLAHARSDIEMILESLTLYIRFNITLSAHTPFPDKATQSIAHERFLKFVDQVGRQIARGKRPFDSSETSKEGA